MIFRNLVIVGVCVLFSCTSCRDPMPARNRFGDGVWEVFTHAGRADVYLLEPDPHGTIAGHTTFASAARRDPQVLHRLWSHMQDYRSFEPKQSPKRQPVPGYLIRYTRQAESVDLVFDFETGFMSMYVTGKPETAVWLSISPANHRIREQLTYLFADQVPRDQRPNL